MTALEKVLVRLRVIEAADDGPDGVDGGGDRLDDGGGALVRTNGVGVMMHKIFRDPDRRRYSPYGGRRRLFMVVDGGRGGDGRVVGGGGVDSLNLNRRRHILVSLRVGVGE